MDRRKNLCECTEVIARAIILDEEKKRVLFCSPKDKHYYYLPGGHIEFTETAKKALRRELLEETGVKTTDVQFAFAGTSENTFIQKGQPRHEINLYFTADKITLGEKMPSKEEHILFSWLPLSEISRFPILPESIKRKCEELAKGSAVSWNDV
ncbi:MAG: NUDIX domain-containing protein [Candidatus Parcubacteria bacterium]|nr:NUDIX domain-containing protein [Candidatus Parcubacteria bacterium]